jgi:hypothetical protein
VLGSRWPACLWNHVALAAVAPPGIGLAHGCGLGYAAYVVLLPLSGGVL